LDNVALFKQAYINAHNANDIDPNIDMANYLIDRMEYNSDQTIWFCFLNAITYQLPTAFLIKNEFPDLECAGIDRLNEWWQRDIQLRLPYQKDKLKQRKFLPETVESYKAVVGRSQTEFFDDLLSGSPSENFNTLWNEFYKPIRHFGRFSVWNFAQMLKSVAGYDIEPDKFFFGDGGAKSITKGARFLFGDVTNAELETRTFRLMEDIRKSVPIDAFKMETELCRYHKYFRTNQSRYIGYYLDRQKEDIESLKMQGWNGIHWQLLDDSRESMLDPALLRLEVQKDKFTIDPEQKMGINMESTLQGFFA